MDQRERIGEHEESLRTAIEGVLSGLYTALPGQVVSVDMAQMTCTVQPTIEARVRQSDGTQIWVPLPVLQNVPIVFMVGGGFALTVPLGQYDEVLVVFSSRCLDSWWQSGGIQVQGELRMHDIHDGFAIPGPRSLPNVLGGVSATTAQLRSFDGTTYVEIAPGGVINIVAPGGLNINGAVVATGEGTFNGGHTVSAHKHGGVQPGGGTSGTPTG